MRGFTAQKGLWNLAREEMLQHRGALSKEEEDIVREYKAGHEENSLSSWVREDVEDKKERKMEVDKESEEVLKGVDETVVNRRCINPFFHVVLLRNSVRRRIRKVVGNSRSDLLGDSCGLSDCVPEVSSDVPVVTGVHVSPSSSVVVKVKKT